MQEMSYLDMVVSGEGTQVGDTWFWQPWVNAESRPSCTWVLPKYTLLS
jgi:hypothetical protein